MTACTQPGCTGRIVDGYCDVCGGPAGAAPFVPVSGFGGITRPCRRGWSNGGRSGVGRFSETERRSHVGLHAARVYRQDRRRLLRRLRQSRGCSPSFQQHGFGGVTRPCRRAWPSGSPGVDNPPPLLTRSHPPSGSLG